MISEHADDTFPFPVYHRQNVPVIGADFSAGAAFLINKPSGWSSFRLVGLIRKYTKVKKTGHAGTLDPMATGLLIVCTGKATKRIHYFQNGIKKYKAEITFGSSTPSYDAETEPDGFAPWNHITPDSLKRVLKTHFTGAILQIPPMYSAIKKNGTPLYKLARQGKSVHREPRKVQIYDCQCTSIELPRVELEITCSKGTYVRSLANDLGEMLNSKGHLSSLERTMIGNQNVEHAFTIDEIDTLLGEKKS